MIDVEKLDDNECNSSYLNIPERKFNEGYRSSSLRPVSVSFISYSLQLVLSKAKSEFFQEKLVLIKQ